MRNDDFVVACYYTVEMDGASRWGEMIIVGRIHEYIEQLYWKSLLVFNLYMYSIDIASSSMFDLCPVLTQFSS